MSGSRALRNLFITGGSGFVGRELLSALARAGATDVVCLARRPEELAAMLPDRLGWRAAPGDLLDEASLAAAIPPNAKVLHLAAKTGKAPRAELSRVNVDGTAAVIAAARRADASGLVFVSSIAARYADQRFAWYARSKRRAEELITASGIPFTIVRPTQVMGSQSPITGSLGRLASGRVPIIFGSGAVRVQPIEVQDLAERLAVELTRPCEGQTVEWGGPRVLTMGELLATLRAAAGRPPRRPIPIPVEPLRSVLGWLEPVALRWLPFSAGQLSAFVNDGAVGRS